MRRLLLALSLPLLVLAPHVALASPAGLPAFTVTRAAGGGETYSVSLQILAVMTALTLLPAAIMMMTSFTRIIVVLAILRQALGTGQTPPNQILLGLALFLTFFVMAPVFNQINSEALQPYLHKSMPLDKALLRAEKPLKKFMLAQTRESDIALFARIAGRRSIASPDKTPMSLLAPAFATSELKTAFEIGFLIYIPFVIIDLVVASVLMAMGMVMLSPQTISFPFKLMLFVLVNGWGLVVGTLAASFHP
ncbi:MAG: flagellar type III secretion system pore protein FliP [Gammaproteobacteria bacterium]|nr:flagellar type III secretion system pore protein FliP [Gammaproteobacteria bacterium]